MPILRPDYGTLPRSPACKCWSRSEGLLCKMLGLSGSLLCKIWSLSEGRLCKICGLPEGRLCKIRSLSELLKVMEQFTTKPDVQTDSG